MPSITPKVALVTGAARRIGAAIIRYLHERGYHVIVHHRGHASDAKALVAELNQQRADSAHLLSADLNQMTDIIALAENTKACWGKLNLLVNSASSFFPTPIGQVTEVQWDELHGSNVKSAFFLTQALLPLLKDNQGSVINIVDIHAKKPLKDYSIYCVAKAGLVMLTQSLAYELAPHVRVNAIAPGAMLPPEGQRNWDDALDETIRLQIPLQRFGGAEPIAQAVYYLAHADYVTGSMLTVDGGWHLHR